MKPTTALIIAGLAMALTGCVVTSVYPFYTDKDLIFETKLLGTWKSAKDRDSKERGNLIRTDTTGYRATLTESSTNSYAAHLFQLDGQMFLGLAAEARHDDCMPPSYLIKIIRREPTSQQ